MKTQFSWIIFGILLGLSIPAVSPARAQSPIGSARDYLITGWTTEQGLPHNTVYSIRQTRDGYLWLATFDGLVRYDGLRFTVFDKNNTPGFTSNRLTFLFEDQDGTLWIGTEDAGLMRYANGVFSSLTTKDGLPHNQILNIQSDNAGGLQITVPGAFVFWRGNRLIPDPDKLVQRWTKRYFAPSGAVWTADQTGLRCVKDGVTTAYPLPIDPNDNHIAVFYEDRQGALWFGVATPALFKIRDGVITHYAAPKDVPAGIRWRKFCEDDLGDLWLATLGAGLLRFRDGQFTVYTKQDGLSDNTLRDIAMDREGNLWVGTNTAGLNRLSRRFMLELSAANGLANNNVYPILQDRAGAIWIGADGHLSRYAEGKLANFDLKDERGITIHAQALFEDSTGRFWVGQYGGVGWIANNRYNNAGFFSTRAVLAIHEDRHGDLWFGTENGLFKCKAGACTEYNTANGLPDKNVKAIHEDRQGALWIGTYGGLARLTDGKFTSWTEREGLASNRVRYIHEDAEGTFWIGTYDGGLSRFRDGRFTNYNLQNGLYNNGVFQILEDARGSFWIGCNKGIYRVSKQQLNDYADGKLSSIICTAYGKQDGMSNIECNGGRQPAGIRANDGRLWFPTQGGVVVVDPEAALLNPVPPPVRVESVMLDRQAVNFRDAVRIAPNQNYLEIEYTGLSFVKSEQTRFRYRLKGRDDDWQEAGTRRVAYYSYLPPGEYTFTVTAANSDGVWNPQGASVRFVVVPPFWRTWWFATLVSLGVMGIVFLGYRQRVASLQRAHAAQEQFSRQLLDSQEQERQRIAAELHDSLGQSLLIIKNRSFLALDSFDDLEGAREQVEEISAASAHAIEEVREIAYNLRPYKMERFGLTKTLQAMCQQAERTSGIRFLTELQNIDGLFSKEAELNLYRVVQESVNNILKHSQATEAKLTIEPGEREVQMKIEDNGQGFKFAPANLQAGIGEARRGGFGLIGMAERVRLLGGAYALDSAPGQGTTITVKLTIPEKNL
ncbi:MAG: two-component regulator propeller domain-containing protein [Acidobacteriota bacterium]